MSSGLRIREPSTVVFYSQRDPIGLLLQFYPHPLSIGMFGDIGQRLARNLYQLLFDPRRQRIVGVRQAHLRRQPRIAAPLAYSQGQTGAERLTDTILLQLIKIVPDSQIGSLNGAADIHNVPSRHHRRWEVARSSARFTLSERKASV